MICLLLEISLFAYMWQFHFQFQLVDPLQKIWYRGFLLENGIYSAILIFFSVTYGGMRLGYMKNTEIIFSQVCATLMADVLIYAELCMICLLYTSHSIIHYNDRQDQGNGKFKASRTVFVADRCYQGTYGSRVRTGHTAAADQTLRNEFLGDDQMDQRLQNLCHQPAEGCSQENGIAEKLFKKSHK